MPLPTFATTPTLDQLAGAAPPSPGAAAPLSFLDEFKLSWKAAGAAPNWGSNQVNWRDGVFDDVDKAIRQKGLTPVVDWRHLQEDVGGSIQPGETYDAAENRLYRKLFAQVSHVRQEDPNFLPDLLPVVDKQSFDQLIVNRRKAALQDVADKAPDGTGLGGFLGDVAHGFVDPVSYIPIVGLEAHGAASIGGRILRSALTAGAINAGITAAEEPLVREDAARLGQPRTAGDFVSDLLTSTAVGGVLGGVVGGAGAARDALTEAFARRNAARAVGTAPPLDQEAAQVFSETVPPEQRTPDEQAALHAVNRDAEVKATSPFVPGPEGDDTHAQWLDQAMHSLNNPDQAVPRGPAKPIDRSTVTAPEDVAGTRFPARETLKAMIHTVEGPHGGRNLAGGNAAGPYQFEPRTWVSLFKRRYPGDPRSFDQIAALREDPHLNDVLINDLISENAAALRHAGFEESAGNLYLAHVLGHDRAVTVLRAHPEAKLGDLLPANYFAHNPFRRGDSAASLIHWAYGKMGDRNALPLHLNTPDVAQGAEAVAAGEADPQAQPATGRFDVEALYGDVGMTDRPVLKPELFDSPEGHAAAQLRFERTRDAADGFAPVMSRAEAFSPVEHFDTLRRYQGRVTSDAIGEALGLHPDEVRRAVAAMQSLDPNSPLMLTRGRPEKLDRLGNVVRPATEAGRVIRRPRAIVSNAPESLVQFLKRNGGIAAEDAGDLIAMDAPASLADRRLHNAREGVKNAKFSKAPPALRAHQIEAAQQRFDAAAIAVRNEPRGMSLDDAFQSAIEHGYFPQHQAYAAAYHDLPDVQDLLDAIDEELRGKPRYSIHDEQAAQAQRDAAMRQQHEDQRLASFDELRGPHGLVDPELLYERTGHNHEAIMEAAGRRGVTMVDDRMLIDTSDLIDAGLPPDEALDGAIVTASVRDLEEYAAASGEMGYEPNDDEVSYIGDLAEERGGELAGGEDGAGDGRSAADPGAAEASRDQLAQSANDPAAGRFADPIGAAAEAQADSVIHDLQMEPPAEGDAATYRLDEEGGESDLQGILDEIEQAQKAAAEMRNCLKPKGGDE